MTPETLDTLSFWAWMAAPIVLGCTVMWLMRPKRSEEPEAEPDPETTIEQRARKAHD